MSMTEFERIFIPRTYKAVKAVSLLANGARYKPTEKEAQHTLGALKDAVNEIAAAYGVLPAAKAEVGIGVKAKENEKITEAPDPDTSEGRIEIQQAKIEASPFSYKDIQINVAAIPENQLSFYITQITARMCDRFDNP